MSGKNTNLTASKEGLHLIVDANILLAGLLRANVTRDFLLDSHFHFYAPEHLLSETEQHLTESDRVRRRIKLSQPKLISLLEVLTADIAVIEQETYSLHIEKALSLAPHEEDAPYLALALHLGIPIWSNDAGMAKH